MALPYGGGTLSSPVERRYPKLTSDDGHDALIAWLVRQGLAKWCGACSRVHPLEAFGADRSQPGDLAGTCLAARHRQGAENRARHRRGHGVRGRS